MKENITRRNRTKIMPSKVGLAVPANVKLKLPIVTIAGRPFELISQKKSSDNDGESQEILS
jgi:hypothetical protein